MLHPHERSGAPHAHTFFSCSRNIPRRAALSVQFFSVRSRGESVLVSSGPSGFFLAGSGSIGNASSVSRCVESAQFHLQPGLLDALIMYTVSKGPSKIVAKTRRGINQNLERLENLRDLSRKSDHEEDTSEEDKINRNVPKPVFYTNGKLKPSLQRHRTRQEVITPQHEELIKFVCDSWNQINARQRCSSSDDSEEYECSSNETIVYYNDGEPNHVLQDFKPFDLESWWGKRLFNNITKSL